MTNSKLENLEAIALIVLVMSNKIILNLQKTIISNVGSSSWINAIYVSILTTLIVLLTIRLFKNFPNSYILDVSKYLGGKLLKTLVAIFYIISFLLITVLIVRSFSESIKIVYFDNLTLPIVILFFVVSACIANLFGLKVISKSNLIVAPLVLLTVVLILLASIQNFIPQRLFPILGHGIKETFLDGSSNVFLFTILAYIYLLPPLLKEKKSYKNVAIISTSISAIYLIINIICLQLVFPFIYDTQEHLSIYLLVRMSRLRRCSTKIYFCILFCMDVISTMLLELVYVLCNPCYSKTHSFI